MKGIIKTKKGFSLVEVIVVMLLIGIIAAVAGTGLVKVVQGMVFTKKNAAVIQKGQIAMTRLVKEFTNIKISGIDIDPVYTNAASIKFTSIKDGVEGSHTVKLAGNTITFDGDILTDQVNGFILNYYDSYDSPAQTTWQSSRRIIEITIQLKGASDVVSDFKARVKPRNL